MAGARRSGRKRAVVLGVVAVVLMAGLATWLSRRSDQAAATPTTSTARAVLTSMSQSVSATGTIAPKTQSNLRFTSSGTVTAVSVKVGDQVTPGQSLATIDDADLRHALSAAQASVDAAYANLSSVKSSTTSTASQLAAANSQVSSAVAKRDTAQGALTAAQLTAPIAGTVAAVNIAVGDLVSGGGTSSGTGSAAAGSGSSGSAGSGASSAGSAGSGSATSSSASIVLITTDAWIVNTSVSAADLASVKKDLQVQLLPTGARALVFGTVSSVGVIATTSSGVASFPVVVAVTGSPQGLYAGGTTNVSIIVKEVPDALAIPTAAIRTEGGRTVVTQVKNGQNVTTAVTIGLVQGALTQITAGLAEGDEVLVESRAGVGGQPGGGTATRTRGTGATGGFGGNQGQQGQQGQGQPGQGQPGAGP